MYQQLKTNLFSSYLFCFPIFKKERKKLIQTSQRLIKKMEKRKKKRKKAYSNNFMQMSTKFKLKQYAK